MFFTVFRGLRNIIPIVGTRADDRRELLLKAVSIERYSDQNQADNQQDKGDNHDNFLEHRDGHYIE